MAANPERSDEKLDRRILKTRRAIYAAFDHMLNDGDITKITVSAIAREADIDRKTFYLHFNSIDDLVSHRIEEALERVLQALKERGVNKTPDEQLHIILEEVNDILLDDLIACTNIATHLSTDQTLQYFEKAVNRVFQHERINKDKMFPDANDMRCKFYRAGGWALYSAWLRSDQTQPIESVSQAIESAIGTSLTSPFYA